MSRAAALEFALRFALAAATLTALAWLAGERYVRTCLPLYRAVLNATLPGGLVLEGPVLRTLDGQRTIAAAVTATRHLAFGGEVAPPGARIDASTLAGHALQHPVLVGALVLAWPKLRRRRLIAAAAALPLLAAVEAVDLPLVLLGAIEDAILAGAGADPHAALMVRWMMLLNGGGRIALSLAVGVIAVAAAHASAWQAALRPAPASPTAAMSECPRPPHRPPAPTAGTGRRPRR
jgi:hypothetical protein